MADRRLHGAIDVLAQRIEFALQACGHLVAQFLAQAAQFEGDLADHRNAVLLSAHPVDVAGNGLIVGAEGGSGGRRVRRFPILRSLALRSLALRSLALRSQTLRSQTLRSLRGVGVLVPAWLIIRLRGAIARLGGRPMRIGAFGRVDAGPFQPLFQRFKRAVQLLHLALQHVDLALQVVGSFDA